MTFQMERAHQVSSILMKTDPSTQTYYQTHKNTEWIQTNCRKVVTSEGWEVKNRSGEGCRVGCNQICKLYSKKNWIGQNVNIY